MLFPLSSPKYLDSTPCRDQISITEFTVKLVDVYFEKLKDTIYEDLEHIWRENWHEAYVTCNPKYVLLTHPRQYYSLKCCSLIPLARMVTLMRSSMP